MNKNQLKEALHNDEPVFGTLITSNSPRWVELTAKLGLDYIFIDTEHVAIDQLTLSWMCTAYKAVGLPPIVRIPSPSPYEATKVLDGGACGIVAPYVEEVDQVQNLRGAVKLRPLKGRKLRNILNGAVKPEQELVEYWKTGSENNILIVNIESVPAMENLDDILQVPGLDGVLIGPHDLSCSLGVPERYTDPVFESAVQKIITKARSKGIGAGIHITYNNLHQEAKWIEIGANLILHSADVIAYVKGIGEDIDYLRQVSGNAHALKDSRNINI